ncbi:MAG: SGNH/GDSL hydrolase family protein [Alphaproteobacteria bacterium]|nr:SGNH/GDSL hydrolase family protein [Alphaproteobacteria bacterium]
MNRANLLTLLVSLLLVVAVTEVVLRVAGVSYPEFNRLDARLGWAPRAGVEGIYAFEGRTYLKINAQGFRDTDHETAKPEGVLRVAVLGDSFTEAREVALPDTYWKVMEREFSACLAASGRRAEVLGFAVNGYGTAQQLMVLEDSVWRYEPDLVVLAFFTGNDLWNNSFELEGHSDRPYMVLRNGELVPDPRSVKGLRFTVKRVWSDIKHGLFNALRTVQLGRQAYKRVRTWAEYRDTPVLEQLMAGLNGALYHVPQDAAWRETWDITEALIRAMKNTVYGHGADFWLVTLSNPAQVHPDAALRAQIAIELGVTGLTYADRRLADFAGAEGIPAVTLVEPLRAYAEAHNSGLHGSGDFAGGHWNTTGHKVTGDLLTRRLCAAYGS